MTDNRNATKTIVVADALFEPGNNLRYNCALIIQDGKIFDIGQRHDLIAGHPDATISEYPGHIISPPFCDHHLHIFENDSEKLLDISDRLLQNSIARIYEAGDKELSGYHAKDALINKLSVHTSGFALFKKGTYGGLLGRGVETINEARDAIDQLHNLGVDFIKIIYSGIFDPRTASITDGGFELDELRDIIVYAKSKGLPVNCHVSGDNKIRSCVEAGVDVVVHGFFASETTLKMMSKRKIAFIPTIAALKRLTIVYEDAPSTIAINRTVDQHSTTIKRAFKLGVKILVGSDSGARFIPYGTAFHEEIALLRNAELPLEAILDGCTAYRLEPGSPANFVLLQDSKMIRSFSCRI